MSDRQNLSDSQRRVLDHIAKAGESENPGNRTTVKSLIALGLVESEERVGVSNAAYMVYRVTARGREAVAERAVPESWRQFEAGTSPGSQSARIAREMADVTDEQISAAVRAGEERSGPDWKVIP